MPLRSSEKKGIIVLSFLLTGFFVFPLLIEEDDTPFFPAHASRDSRFHGTALDSSGLPGKTV